MFRNVRGKVKRRRHFANSCQFSSNLSEKQGVIKQGVYLATTKRLDSLPCSVTKVKLYMPLVSSRACKRSV